LPSARARQPILRANWNFLSLLAIASRAKEGFPHF